jgi:hypothetical protein
MWCYLSNIFGKNLGSDFEAVARWWISKKKNAILNTCCATLMWCIWTTRNDLFFQGVAWRNEKVMMIKLIKTLKRWLSGVQECRLAGVRSCGGGSYNQSTPTVTHRLGWSECSFLKLPDGDTIKFGTLNWANVSE